MKRHLTLICICAVILIFFSCGKKKEFNFSGRTMGTTYHIKAVTKAAIHQEALQKKIDQELKAINQSMSTYIKESEISTFNAINDTNTPYKVSDGFYSVLKTAAEIHLLTKGAWDGTIDPLVTLWGFGRNGSQDNIPDSNAIKERLLDIGFDQISIIDDEKALIKKNPKITLDLASIAKGYGVDRIGYLLLEEGIMDFIVEIGGEIYARGVRSDGKKWRVGINRPHKNAAQNEVVKVVALKDAGFATSGNYRNFIEIDGKLYSHIIDPRTGYPVDNKVVSVSVVAPTCAFADGLATAIMVMGPEKGIALIDQLENVEGLVITEDSPRKYSEFSSKGFSTLN